MLLSSFHLVTTEPFRTALGKREMLLQLWALGSGIPAAPVTLSDIKGGPVDWALETDLG